MKYSLSLLLLTFVNVAMLFAAYSTGYRASETKHDFRMIQVQQDVAGLERQLDELSKRAIGPAKRPLGHEFAIVFDEFVILDYYWNQERVLTLLNHEVTK